MASARIWIGEDHAPFRRTRGRVLNAEEEIGYVAEIRWSTLCALLKEEILEIIRDDDRDSQVQRAR